jgi:hypothetical protein
MRRNLTNASFPCPISFYSKQGSLSADVFRDPAIPTIRLQWNPKPKKMMVAKIFLRQGGGRSDNDKDFFK